MKPWWQGMTHFEYLYLAKLKIDSRSLYQLLSSLLRQICQIKQIKEGKVDLGSQLEMKVCLSWQQGLEATGHSVYRPEAEKLGSSMRGSLSHFYAFLDPGAHIQSGSSYLT